jgi:hypothetical protein
MCKGSSSNPVYGNEKKKLNTAHSRPNRHDAGGTGCTLAFSFITRVSEPDQTNFSPWFRSHEWLRRFMADQLLKVCVRHSKSEYRSGQDHRLESRASQFFELHRQRNMLAYRLSAMLTSPARPFRSASRQSDMHEGAFTSNYRMALCKAVF